MSNEQVREISNALSIPYEAAQRLWNEMDREGEEILGAQIVSHIQVNEGSFERAYV